MPGTLGPERHACEACSQTLDADTVSPRWQLRGTSEGGWTAFYICTVCRRRWSVARSGHHGHQDDGIRLVDPGL